MRKEIVSNDNSNEHQDRRDHWQPKCQLTSSMKAFPDYSRPKRDQFIGGWSFRVKQWSPYPMTRVTNMRSTTNHCAAIKKKKKSHQYEGSHTLCCHQSVHSRPTSVAMNKWPRLFTAQLYRSDLEMDERRCSNVALLIKKLRQG
jgi:hypothetical protein